MSKAPTMSRSRSQIANSYAPEALFTFEGGMGACIAKPSSESAFDVAQLSPVIQLQILQRIDDIAHSWFERAFSCRDGTQDPAQQVLGQFCIDEELLNRETGSATREVRESRVLFVNALHMSYLPEPLSFKCTDCGFFRQSGNVKTLAGHSDAFTREACPHPKRLKRCSWRQLDVVHVHWSGTCTPPMTDRFDWNSADGEVYRRPLRCSRCDRQDFLLDDSSPYISKWHLVCAHCDTPQGSEWLQRDKRTIELLGARFPSRVRDAAMALTSYRASAAYYAQSEQFIIFHRGHEDSLQMLDARHRTELEAWVARRFGYSDIDQSDEWIAEQLRAVGDTVRTERFARKRRLVERCEAAGAAADELTDARNELKEFRDQLFEGDNPVLRPPAALPSEVAGLIGRRDGNTRFDPIRLALEHDILRESTLDCAADQYGRRRFVPLNHMDADLRPTDDPIAVRRIEEQTRLVLDRMKIARFGLLREFDLCRFTFGYSRMSPTPILNWLNAQMPVRLNLFPKIKDRESNDRHPIYVLTQSNEAFYVQLRPEAVHDWLAAIGALEGIVWSPGDRRPLAAHLLERARIFPRFMDSVSQGPPSAYVYTFTLLHTLAHGFMKAISAVSGLELGSMSEYLFPTDLSFVVYRSGTTMDLGNLSSLWRNENTRFLTTLLEARSWLCNSGTLCSDKGAACPDCLLVPETSCIAQNQLLSRSVVGSGRAPLEDERKGFIRGFFE